MRNFRRRASLAAALGLVATLLAGAPAGAATWARAAFPATAPAATPVSRSSETFCAGPFVNEDPRLGPVSLPAQGPLGRILSGYAPLGGLAPQAFLDRYWNWAAGSYRLPPDLGFAHSGGYSSGRPLVDATTLHPGAEVDRFGGEGGAFLAPIGTPYGQRSIPPTNLSTYPATPEYPCNYHAYRVSKDFAVEIGPIASAYQQVGGANQYHLVSRLIPDAPQTRGEVSVAWLVRHGYLERLN